MVCALQVCAGFRAASPPRRWSAARRESRRDGFGRRDGSEEADSVTGEAEVFSRRRLSNETLPTECWDTTPPRNMIGVYALSTLVANGDVLRTADERTFVVKRVASLYKFSDGKFHPYKKRVDATEAARDALETRLERLLPKA